jgi:hypothetical protein
MATSETDSRLLEAAAFGKTDLVLQLLEEEGSKLHDQKDQVNDCSSVCIFNFRRKIGEKIGVFDTLHC